MAAIDYLADTDTVHIATESPDGREVVTPIWSVVVDGVPYIRAAFGADTKWYQRIQRTRRAAFIDGTDRYQVSVENVDDDAENDRVDDAYRAKFPDEGQALTDVIAPLARSLTMRLTVE
jgi:hypothetical protein